MGAKELNEKLLETFPQLRKSFDNVTSWQEGIETGSIIVFEDVYFKYLKRYLHNEKISNKNFKFIKLLLDSNDDYAINVVTVAIIENLVATTKRELYVKYFDNTMKKIANEIGREYFYNWKDIE